MKQLKSLMYVAFAGVALFALGACDGNEQSDPGTGQVPVTFIPQIEGVSTRAVDQTWSATDKVGIAMVTAGAAVTGGDAFVEHKVSAGGTAVGLSPVDAAQTLYYPADGSNVNFVAFSPFTTVTGTQVSYTGFTDQSTVAKMEAVDFLYHKGTTAYNKGSVAAALGFAHKMSKLIINVSTSADEDTKITLPTLTMLINGMPGSATANLADGAVTPGANAAITPMHTDGSNTRTATAIIVPHAAKAGRIIAFTCEEGDFEYEFANDLPFDANKIYTLNFDVTREGAQLVNINTNASIGAWEAGVTIAETVILPKEDSDPVLVTASNSYIVKAGSKKILIPVSRANEHAADAIGATDELTAEVLWSDVQNLVAVEVEGQGATGFVKVTTTATATDAGNAVVAVKVGGVIKWSWHIWVTDYEPSGTWMDRNLGALSGTPADGAKTFGLYYQWGRKDPFPSTASNSGNNNNGAERTIYSLTNPGGATYVITTAASQTYASTISNPTTFITSYSDSPNDYWDKGGTNKSIYDPCPKGYRVPKGRTPWGTDINHSTYPWNASLMGRELTSVGGWYPTVGSRNDTGKIANTHFCFVWSSEISGNNPYYARFLNNGLDLSVNYYARTFALSVRCTLE